MRRPSVIVVSVVKHARKGSRLLGLGKDNGLDCHEASWFVVLGRTHIVFFLKTCLVRHMKTRLRFDTGLI